MVVDVCQMHSPTFSNNILDMESQMNSIAFNFTRETSAVIWEYGKCGTGGVTLIQLIEWKGVFP